MRAVAVSLGRDRLGRRFRGLQFAGPLLLVAAAIDTSAYVVAGTLGAGVLWWVLDMWLLQRVWLGGHVAWGALTGLTLGALLLLVVTPLLPGASVDLAHLQVVGYASAQVGVLGILLCPAVRAQAW